MRGNRRDDNAARHDALPQARNERHIFFDMLEHVERADERKRVLAREKRALVGEHVFVASLPAYGDAFGIYLIGGNGTESPQEREHGAVSGAELEREASSPVPPGILRRSQCFVVSVFHFNYARRAAKRAPDAPRTSESSQRGLPRRS